MLLVLMAFDLAAAQPSGAAYPQRSPACLRLEAQLAALDRGAGDVRAEQIRRYEEAASRQQVELDRISAQARRAGCEGGGFFLFGGGVPPQCDQMNRQMQRMRANLDRILSGLDQLQGGSQREEQRESILVALAQNDCGPQYRTTGRSPGFLESLFGAPPGAADIPTEQVQSGTFRTVCVRTCDGSFFPISYATHPARFQDDERTCQRACPATETVLYAHRSAGEDMRQAVSINGRPYTELPTAFKYRQEYNAACTCKRPGESWIEAVKEDQTLAHGDIVVTEEWAKALSQPKAESPQRAETHRRDRTRAGAATPRDAGSAQAPPSAPSASTSADTGAPVADRPRTVGPQFYR